MSFLQVALWLAELGQVRVPDGGPDSRSKAPPSRAGDVFLAPLCPWWSLGFSGVSTGQLSFNKGDILRVISKVDGDWLQCSLGSKKGLVPIMYITHLENEDY
uniref:SH3 domain-containing protein n=1 Tax=Otus sunia TaxID=257818 RepID=A0A8C8E7D7_9STRI